MAFVTDITSASFNSYSTVEYADTYFTERLYADDWNNADTTSKQAVLVWASKLIDTSFIWTGARKDFNQPMGFPRYGLYDPEGYYVSSDSIPRAVTNAACELAMLLIREDRTAFGEPTQTGLTDLKVGSIDLRFNTKDKKEIVPKYIRNMLLGFWKSVRDNSSVVDVMRS